MGNSEALIAIAHPKFQAELFDYAERARLLEASRVFAA